MTCDHRWQYVKPWPWEEKFTDGRASIQHEGGEYWCSLCKAGKLMVYRQPEVLDKDEREGIIEGLTDLKEGRTVSFERTFGEPL